MAYQDPNAIVTVQVSTILAPAVPSYQQTGAIVSFGGTTIPPNTRQVLTQYVDLKGFTPEPNPITSITWAGGVVTVEVEDPLDASYTSGDVIKMHIAECVPEAYNGMHDCIIGNANQFTYNLTTDPGIMSKPGVVQSSAANNLNAQVSTFFRQGVGAVAYILELGTQPDLAAEVTALETWLNDSPGSFYGYLLPDYWGTAANIPATMQLYEQFTDPEAMVYFWLTIELASIGLIPKTCKCVIQLVEAPTVAEKRANAVPGQYAEFTMAGMFYWAMQFRATAVTRVAPMNFKYIYGVTPYPTDKNGPLLVSFKENAINYIQTGAQGGVAYTNVYQGVTADGFDYFNWWWTIDWVQIQVNLDLSNAIISAANNPLAPLYYDQGGINFLEGTLAATMFRGSQYGMVNGAINQTKYDSATLAQQIQLGTFSGTCNVNAVPFNAYTTQNPGDYGRGEYDGLSTIFIPSRGFVHILVVVVATNLVSA